MERAAPRVSVKSSSLAASKADAAARNAARVREERAARRALKKTRPAPRAVLLLAAGGDASALRAAMQRHLLNNNNHSSNHSSSLLLLSADADSVLDVLEACLVADVIVPVVDAVRGVSAQGVKLASVIKAQGLPAVLPAITGFSAVANNLRHATKKGLLEDLKYLFPNVVRVLPADESEGDLGQIFRFLETTKLVDMHFRAPRSFVLAEKVEFEPMPGEESGMLRVTGYVRGGAGGLSCDSLVHIPGVGDMQLERIVDAKNGAVLHTPSELRPALKAENDPDPFAGGEQTWPTEADVAMAGMSDDDDNDGEGDDDKHNGEDILQEAVKGRKLRRRIPAGMSDYQAAWLPDSGDEEEEEADDNEDDGGDNARDGGNDQMMEESSGGNDDEQLKKKVFDSDHDDDDGDHADAMKDDDDDDDNVVDKERDEQRWPDEVEAPQDIPARERFQKYRGLDSFRTAAWDPRENLPPEYSRIFQIPNYAHFVRRTTRSAIEAENLPVPFGTEVVLYMRCANGVAEALLRGPVAAGRPLVVGTLLKHENKISVLHFDVMKHHEFTEPIQSGETLVACFGLRRLEVTPIFSQHVSGCDKCKYERFLPSGASSMSMASFFGPITVSPCSITLFKMVGSNPVLVASGTLRTCNADLLLIKKIILTAHPTRVHKRTAVCKGMFYFPTDVRWFKPVSIWTKQGRIGHIKESNGTKGAFKAVFDGQLNNSDVVCLSLYKRVFPKWKFENFYGK